MEERKRQPNVLFLMTDQFRGDWMSCVGGPARTPNLDLIASEGVVFTRCSTCAPLCVPARVGLFSGKYAHTTGAWDNTKFILSEDANIWSKKFRGLGYSTSMFGKTHLHGGSGDIISREPMLEAYGFDAYDEITGPHASCKSRTHMTERWKELGLFDAFAADVAERGKTPFAKPSPLPLEEYYDVYVGDRGVEYLQNYTGDRPWFCHVSFGGPHEPWDVPEPYSSMYRKEDMPRPRPRMKNANPDRPRGETDVRMSVKKIHCTPEVAAEIRADYSGNCTLIDDQIGRIFDVIRARAEWDNTIILFTADHGEMNGDQEFVNKRTFLDGALNIPLIIRTPETAAKGGFVTDALVSLIDVGPTLVDLCGGAVDYPQCGLSLRGVIEGTCEKPRDYVLSELMGEIMYMDEEWKAAVNTHGEIYLLFDRKNDPEEQLNLAASEEARDTENMLRAKIIKAVAGNIIQPSTAVQGSKALHRRETGETT
ncbi:MAG: sulfatase-like hydrolase/transferase [Clostridiales bacterium]|nr:sulfatase-like hydrolase/transferase [Clostridiales bacterium]